MTIEVAIPSRQLFDTIVSGVEGGIQYWAEVLVFSVPGATVVPNQHEPDVKVICDVLELDSGERIALQDKWASALRLMAERHPRKFAELVSGTGDCTTGDVLIQLAAFGELRYG